MKFFKILSLQKKLLLTFLTLWFFTVVIATWAAYWFSGSAAQVSFDRVLKDDALALAAQVKWDASGPRFDVDSTTANLLIFDSLSPSKFTLFDKYNQKIAGNADLPTPRVDEREHLHEAKFFDLSDQQGDLRVVALRIDHANTKDWVWVLVGESHSKRRRISHELAAAIFLPAVGLAFVIVPLLLVGIRFGLSPAKQLSEAVAEKGIDDLSPLSLDNVPEELRVVILHINDLLKRLEASVAHERLFVADAAHQLRTPVAGIKLLIEDLVRTHKANPHQPPDSEVLQELNAASTRATHLVRQLLSLARSERADMQQLEQFSLHDLLSEVVSQWQRSIAAAHKNLSLGPGMNQIDQVTIAGSALLLEEAIGNIVDNAVQYGGSQIQVDASLSEGELTLRIEDDGQGVSPQHIPLMLTPFWRGEHSNTIGVGLGLSIAEKALKQMGGRLQIRSRPEFAGTSVCVTLPVQHVKRQGV